MDAEPSVQIPSAYHHLLPAAILEGAPRERHATCSNCAMCTTSSLPQKVGATGVFFDPQTKCCTYHPDLPNYAIGGILQDQSVDATEGRLRIQKKIVERIGVLPSGIARPKKHRLLYNSGPDAFGRAASLRCPYYIDGSGLCSVWKYRDAICSTWFCKHERGALGQRFWAAVGDYLEHAQELLVRYSLTQLGWSVNDLFGLEWGDPYAIGSNRLSNRALSPEEIDDRAPSDSAYRKIWGSWVGRETELYARCYDVIGTLTRADVKRLGGYHLEVLEERISLQHEAMVDEKVPAHLRKNPEMRIQRQADGRFILTSYRRYDPIVLSAEVYSLLDWFDGIESTQEIIARIEKDKALRFSPLLVRRLYERSVLIQEAAELLTDQPVCADKQQRA